MSTGNPTLDSVLTIVGALTVILSVVANMPAVRATKVGEALIKLSAVDLLGLLRLVLPLFMKAKPEVTSPERQLPTKPSDHDAN